MNSFAPDTSRVLCVITAVYSQTIQTPCYPMGRILLLNYKVRVEHHDELRVTPAVISTALLLFSAFQIIVLSYLLVLGGKYRLPRS